MMLFKTHQNEFVHIMITKISGHQVNRINNRPCYVKQDKHAACYLHAIESCVNPTYCRVLLASIVQDSQTFLESSHVKNHELLLLPSSIAPGEKGVCVITQKVSQKFGGSWNFIQCRAPLQFTAKICNKYRHSLIYVVDVGTQK